ncbi:MAG: hypothetical protein FWC16_06365 [Defluviitaleaceae bacterium]|nr:hypothetical protein [Defluviitaleaceae bacterium]MCL2274533.1 hypothetical protein [Defluviitaleaceae bacterium]
MDNIFERVARVTVEALEASEAQNNKEALTWSTRNWATQVWTFLAFVWVV